MEHIISKEQLGETRKKTHFFSLNESKRILSSRSAYSGEIKVFLSHHHGDDEILENVINELKSLGVDVYVDWNDSGMPSVTSSYTAMRIKEKIRSCKKFILIATEGAIESKWCNWELGYGDAFRYRDNIAIMPIRDTRDKEFSGIEYLSIYPIITNQYQYSLGTYYVEYNGVRITLIDWLKQ